MESACYSTAMSRRIRLILAACLSLAASSPAYSQDTPNANPAAGAASSSAPAGDDLAKLQTENAALKKAVADAARTIAQLQGELDKAGIHHRAATADTNAPGAAETAGTPAAAESTDAASTGPKRALPLDATNVIATAAAPGADAGPSRSYTVTKGDSLWKIAHKMYPHDTLNGEDKIRDANKDVFNGKFLQPGQVLVIPQ